MVVSEMVREAAAALADAYVSATPIEPLRATYPDLDIATAYAIQLAQVEAWRADGRTVRGHKIGLTSRPMQRMLGVDQPDFGHLTDDMFFPEDEPIDLSQFIAPRVEPELAFVLGGELHGPGVLLSDAVRAVDFALPAVEIIDSRVRDWDIRIEDTVADNASSGGVVLGARPTRLTDIDLRGCGCQLAVDGQTEQTGAGAAVFGGPLGALVWLANTLGEHGTVLGPGDVVLSGSWTAAVEVASGSVVHADLGDLGTVNLRFSR